ncbi:hypothetical protein [Teredinibacter turnerae]|uniref:hypothetical protein n=1 Tax=Teredinibacter turnerae TaxID=2426 RepID=UPI0003617184|nr:hypothetical protein [Teredinibacter turnerae]
MIDYNDDYFTNYPAQAYRGLTPNTILVPLDWQTFDHLPGPAAFFQVDTGTNGAPNYYFATVLDDEDLIFIKFRLCPNFFGPKHIPPEEWVDQRNMKKLMFDIFNTLEIQLSPEAEARRVNAIKGLKDTSLKQSIETQTFYTHPDRVAANSTASASKKTSSIAP